MPLDNIPYGMERSEKCASVKDWLEVGITTLGQSGASGLTIERMISELGVTADVGQAELMADILITMLIGESDSIVL